MAYETSIERERAITSAVLEQGPAAYGLWAQSFMSFRNRMIGELEKLRVPDDWLVKASLAASRAWEAENPCPLSNDEIELLRAEAARSLP